MCASLWDVTLTGLPNCSKKKMLSYLAIWFQVVRAYILACVSLIAGRRHFLYLLYLKDSSEQVIAFYLQHTVHHFCFNRIGNYHFYIYFFIHFCFTKYLCKENDCKVRFSVFFSIQAFSVIRIGDIMRCYDGSWQNMNRISFREESAYKTSFSPFSVTTARAKRQQFTCISMAGLSRVMSLCTSTWIPPSTWHKAVTWIVLSVVNCCWYSVYGILMGNCFSGKKRVLIHGCISPQSFVPNISIFPLCCVWD